RDFATCSSRATMRGSNAWSAAWYEPPESRAILLDQGLPRTAVDALARLGFATVHTGAVGLATASDETILDRARRPAPGPREANTARWSLMLAQRERSQEGRSDVLRAS